MEGKNDIVYTYVTVYNTHQREGKYYTCPVCAGTGQRQHGFYNDFGYNNGTTTFTCSGTVICRSCGGTGVIWG
jgi:hypothetical protein